jgi:16S rRNA (cytosine967-C5)-methyltransferase
LARQSGGFRAGRQEAPAPAPPGMAARVAAARAVGEALTLSRPLEERLAADLTMQRGGLDPRDRALARSIATVALRRLGTIRKALARRLEKGLPRRGGALEWTLIVAAAQILFLDAPDHAAVDLAVKATRADPASAPFAALANAVLRAIARDRDAILTDSDPLDDDTPAWLAQRWRSTYGESVARAIATAHRAEPTLDLSVKSDASGWAERLGGVVLPTGSVRLDTHKPVAELEGYGDGEWWVQDAAAALPARLLRPQPGMRVVDLCAAPGGKAAELAAMGVDLTAVDRSAERLKLLAANFERLRLRTNVVVADALSFDAAPFDAVLLDAPCSATGTIRRHPDVAWIKRQGDLAPLVKLQADLLNRAIALAKPGGVIVYCVCSLEPEEGEAHITAVLRRNPDVRRQAITPDEVGCLTESVTPSGDLRTLPCHLWGDNPRRSGLDGFFAARLVKAG